MIKVFLVEDDKPPALRKLERMVAAVEDLSICGRAGACAAAIAGILETKPQLAIVDVRLPDGTGFEVLQALDESSDLQTIFLTAYDQYAAQAFEIAASDYLLKPVAQDRFLNAVQRVRDRLAEPLAQPARRYARRFLVERRNAAYLLPVESIYRIAADRKLRALIQRDGRIRFQREPATATLPEGRLDPAEFVRVSRSAIVRVGAIREVRKTRGPEPYRCAHFGR